MFPTTAERQTTGPIPLAELNVLHKTDCQAARSIVLILLGIFGIGLLMYLFICFSVV